MDTVSVGDHATSLLNSMWELYQDGHLTDCVLVLEDENEEIHVHKSILVAYSPVFKDMLHSGEPFVERNVLENTTKESAEVVVRFLYRGNLELSSTNVYGVLALAARLQIDKAVAECQKYLEAHAIRKKSGATALRVRKDITDTAYSPKRKRGRPPKVKVPDPPAKVIKQEVATPDDPTPDSDPEWGPDLQVLDSSPPKTKRRSTRSTQEPKPESASKKKAKSLAEKLPGPTPKRGRGRPRKSAPRLESDDQTSPEIGRSKPKLDLTHECDVCSKWFRHHSSLQLHKKSHNVGLPRSRVALVCHPSAFMRSSRPIKPSKPAENGEHDGGMRTRTRRKAAEETAEKSSTETPEKSPGEPLTKPDHACTICDRTFPLYTTFRAHYFSTHVAKFKCRSCPKGFTNRKRLNLHQLRSHHKLVATKPKQCGECQRCFMHAKNLDKHYAVAHPGVKPKVKGLEASLKTPIKKPASAPALYRKTRWHCQECHEPCSSRKALAQHIQAVHPTVQYDCKLCSYKTKMKTLLDG